MALVMLLKHCLVIAILFYMKANLKRLLRQGDRSRSFRGRTL